jgi:hypothetical protein
MAAARRTRFTCSAQVAFVRASAIAERAPNIRAARSRVEVIVSMAA